MDSLDPEVLLLGIYSTKILSPKVPREIRTRTWAARLVAQEKFGDSILKFHEAMPKHEYFTTWKNSHRIVEKKAKIN